MAHCGDHHFLKQICIKFIRISTATLLYTFLVYIISFYEIIWKWCSSTSTNGIIFCYFKWQNIIPLVLEELHHFQVFRGTQKSKSGSFFTPWPEKGDYNTWHSGCFFNDFYKCFIKALFPLSKNWLIWQFLYVLI